MRRKGYQVRSRASWIKLGRRALNVFFLGLEKSRQTNNAIHSVKYKTGSEQLEDQEILQAARYFFKCKSGASAIEDVDHYIESVTLERSAADQDKLECEVDIAYNEYEAAIKSMRTNKSSGLDGICIEFYKRFWHY